MSSHRDAHPYGRSAEDVQRRERRRSRTRRVRITQLVVLSVLIIALACTAWYAWLQLNRPEEAPAPAAGTSDGGGARTGSGGIVCPPPGAVPSPPGEVRVSVRNGTAAEGLAGQTGQELASRGFALGEVGNTEAPGAAVVIVHGPQGYLAASAVAAEFDGAELRMDEREGTAVDLILGDGSVHMLPADAAAERLAAPVAAPAGC